MRAAVYGTLKKGGRLHAVLKDNELLGEHITEPLYTMLDLGWFPGVLNTGSTAIHIEVYLIDEQKLQELDAIEGYPNLYIRNLIKTPYGEAWMYFFNTNKVEQRQHNVITTGEWKV